MVQTDGVGVGNVVGVVVIVVVQILHFFLHFCWVLMQSSEVQEVSHLPAFFFSLHFEADHISAHTVTVVVIVMVFGVVVVVPSPSSRQKVSGTRMATENCLGTFSSWLNVDQLHMNEEQVSL